MNVEILVRNGQEVGAMQRLQRGQIGAHRPLKSNALQVPVQVHGLILHDLIESAQLRQLRLARAVD